MNSLSLTMHPMMPHPPFSRRSATGACASSTTGSVLDVQHQGIWPFLILSLTTLPFRMRTTIPSPDASAHFERCWMKIRRWWPCLVSALPLIRSGGHGDIPNTLSIPRRSRNDWTLVKWRFATPGACFAGQRCIKSVCTIPRLCAHKTLICSVAFRQRVNFETRMPPLFCIPIPCCFPGSTGT